MWLSTPGRHLPGVPRVPADGEDGGGRGVLSAMQRQGIQRKLLLTFVPLIIVIIFVLAFSLLRDFSRTILSAVNANGEGLADRTASVVKANPRQGPHLTWTTTSARRRRRTPRTTGQNSSFRFNTLSFYRRDVKGGGFLVWASTDRKQIDQRAAQPETALTGITSRYNPATADLRVPRPGDAQQRLHRLRHGGLRAGRDLRAVLPHPGEGLRDRGAVHVRSRSSSSTCSAAPSCSPSCSCG